MVGVAHTDGICLNTSVWLDGVRITDKGVLLDPGLKKLMKELGKIIRRRPVLIHSSPVWKLEHFLVIPVVGSAINT